jgi:glycerol-3-phosphate dehydrogenase
MMYDAYTGANRTVPRHQFLSRGASLGKWKQLNPEIVNTATYYDGLISNPERLALELVLDAEAENTNARALNYMSMISGEKDMILLRDELTDQTYEVHPKLVINAAGPWIDFTNYNLGLSTKYIGGTKGSHLVLDHPELRTLIGEHEFFFENKDGRIVLIFPLQDRVLVGTSDIKIDHPDEAVCTDEEVEYFLGMIARVFPTIKVTRENIVFRFTGVRPLASSVAKSTGQYSRDHSIQVLSGDWTSLLFPVYSLVGGKWTSFRAFAEQVTDKALDFLGKARKKNTRDLPIGGGRGFATNPTEQARQVDGFAAWTGLSKDHLQTLYTRYGSRTETIASFISKADDAPLKSLAQYTRREITFLVLHEKAIHLSDIVLRRTMLAMLGRLSKQGIEELADVMGDCLGWNADKKAAEMAQTLRILADRHGVQF